MSIERETSVCTEKLKAGKIILYPTDTIWGIGCDATNEEAVKKIFALKQREERKSMIILLADKQDVGRYVDDPAPELLAYVTAALKPATAVYEKGKNVADSLINEDGTIAVRITKDAFCLALLKKLGKPVVSTSANISGKPAPANFKDISAEIKNGVDYIVQHRQSDFKDSRPSSIIKMSDKKIVILRS